MSHETWAPGGGRSMVESLAKRGISARRVVVPLALCQFIASYAASNMNVAISSIAHDLDTTVIGVQTAITLFTLTMAALMIPGSKLTDIWSRKRCFMLGLVVYGVGATIAALAFALPVLILGYSLLEGIGSALMIPPIYIIITVLFTDLPSRAKAFGIVSAAAGVGAAGSVVLALFFLYERGRERAGREPLLPLRLFRSRVSDLGLVTQNVQWLIMQGSIFVISVFLQEVRHFSAIETGLALTPATIGL